MPSSVTLNPSFNPSFSPSNNPSYSPTLTPSDYPSYTPSFNPSNSPSLYPSYMPSVYPSTQPSRNPIITSFAPSEAPSDSTSYSSTELSESPIIRNKSVASYLIIGGGIVIVLMIFALCFMLRIFLKEKRQSKTGLTSEMVIISSSSNGSIPKEIGETGASTIEVGSEGEMKGNVENEMKIIQNVLTPGGNNTENVENVNSEKNGDFENEYDTGFQNEYEAHVTTTPGTTME